MTRRGSRGGVRHELVADPVTGTLSMPPAMARLPRDARGYPVFWTCAIDGEGRPAFRVLEHARVLRALAQRLCGMCGGRLGGNHCCLFGTSHDLEPERWGGVWVRSTDPPMHEACARYAVAVCPFLSGRMVRRIGTPPEGEDLGNYLSDHAPERPDRIGLFFTRSYEARWRDEIQGFRYARPFRVEWFA